MKIHASYGLTGPAICGQKGAKKVKRLWYYGRKDSIVGYLLENKLTPNDLCRKCYAVDFIKEQYKEAVGLN